MYLKVGMRIILGVDASKKRKETDRKRERKKKKKRERKKKEKQKRKRNNLKIVGFHICQAEKYGSLWLRL